MGGFVGDGRDVDTRARTSEARVSDLPTMRRTNTCLRALRASSRPGRTVRHGTKWSRTAGGKRGTKMATRNANGDGGTAGRPTFDRPDKAFPLYMADFEGIDCRSMLSTVDDDDPLWTEIRKEAARDAEAEPMLSSFLYASVLVHSSVESVISFVLANRLAEASMLSTKLKEVFDEVLASDANLREALRCDLLAVKDRDPACTSYVHALLYFKGFHALQAHKISHTLWCRGQKVMAIALQSRMSEEFGVDIHPGASIGKGVLLDHGQGIVIGETAVVGDRVSIMQGVTLGGTGKDAGDRHPKVRHGCLIGAHAAILGNIEIGHSSLVAAGSLVLKDVGKRTMVAGSPAKVVGVTSSEPSRSMIHEIKSEVRGKFCKDWEDAVQQETQREKAMRDNPTMDWTI
uniref:serine O-acetyltransferase n=1 Tax=Picocystis salinarum TaxID=88271 RepID=A0A6U9RKU6_9CHLO